MFYEKSRRVVSREKILEIFLYSLTPCDGLLFYNKYNVMVSIYTHTYTHTRTYIHPYLYMFKVYILIEF